MHKLKPRRWSQQEPGRGEQENTTCSVMCQAVGARSGRMCDQVVQRKGQAFRLNTLVKHPHRGTPYCEGLVGGDHHIESEVKLLAPDQQGVVHVAAHLRHVHE